VFQWTETGGEFPELNFGGDGKTDKFGTTGNSKTGAHHILGVAETIKRGLPPEFVITQASAHAAPAEGNEFLVVNWIRAAAIIAQVDPVAGFAKPRFASSLAALGRGTAPLLGPNDLATGRPERGLLDREVLIGRAHPGISDEALDHSFMPS
jgi:hypothetical protein